MRDRKNPEGRVFDIKPKRQWSRDTKDDVAAAGVQVNDLPSRTVLVVGRSGQKRGWCRVACIVNHKSPLANDELYIPFSPTRKNSSTGMQLTLCFGHRFYRRSWVDLDGEIVELPRWVLEDTGMELQSKSFGRLEDFMDARGVY